MPRNSNLRGAVRQHVTRLSIPLDHFGVLQHEFSNVHPGTTKRARKTRFNKLKQTLRTFNYIDAKDTVHSISVGIDAAGIQAVEVTYT